MKQFLEVAVRCAREAGTLLRGEFARPKEISYKGEVDIVTESDRRSEALIVARLREKFPEHAIVGEEGGSGSSSSPQPASAKYCWYVDPLDGTTNFAHGYPCFAVSIGLLEEGNPIVAAVLNPVSDELFTAVRGEGAYLNGKPMRVSSITSLQNSLVATGFPTDHRKRSSNIDYYWEFTLRSHGVRRDGSAALDLCSVACGRFEAFWEFGLKAWDSAAGILLVTEAGGKVTTVSGGVYHPGDREMIASNGNIHGEMREVATLVGNRTGNS